MVLFIVAVLAVVFSIWWLVWYNIWDLKIADWIMRKYRQHQAGLGYKKRERDAG